MHVKHGNRTLGMEQALRQGIDEVDHEEHVDANQGDQVAEEVNEDGASEEVKANAAAVDGDGESDGDDDVGRGSPQESGELLKLDGGRCKVANESQSKKGLPVPVVKRIIKLDPDIRLVSKEGIFAIIQTTQLFLETFAAESLSQARRSKRKGVKADDLLVVSKNNGRFRDCLGNSLSDFLRSLEEGDDTGDSGSEGRDQEDLEEDPELSKNKIGPQKKKKTAPPPPSNHSMTDFFLRRVVKEKDGPALVDGE